MGEAVSVQSAYLLACIVAVTFFVAGYLAGMFNEQRYNRKTMKEWQRNLEELSRLLAQGGTGE